MAKGRENLIPLNQRTKEEQRIIARNGGIKSGIVRKKIKEEKRLIKNILEQIMFLPINTKEKEALKKAGLNDTNMPTDKISLACYSVVQKCISRGDSQALVKIAELSGHHIDEKKVQIGGDGIQRKIINIISHSKVVITATPTYIDGGAYGSDEE